MTTSHFVLHSFRDTCSVRSLSSPMSSMAKRTSSFKESVCLSSFSCWHSAISCNIKKKKKGKLSNPHSAILRRHITYVYHHISSYSLSPSLGYFWPQKKPKQRSPRYSAVNRQDSNFPEQLWDTKDSHNGLNKGMLQEPLNKHIK